MWVSNFSWIIYAFLSILYIWTSMKNVSRFPLVPGEIVLYGNIYENLYTYMYKGFCNVILYCQYIEKKKIAVVSNHRVSGASPCKHSTLFCFFCSFSFARSLFIACSTILMPDMKRSQINLYTRQNTPIFLFLGHTHLHVSIVWPFLSCDEFVLASSVT